MMLNIILEVHHAGCACYFKMFHATSIDLETHFLSLLDYSTYGKRYSLWQPCWSLILPNLLLISLNVLLQFGLQVSYSILYLRTYEHIFHHLYMISSMHLKYTKGELDAHQECTANITVILEVYKTYFYWNERQKYTLIKITPATSSWQNTVAILRREVDTNNNDFRAFAVLK